MKRWWRVLGIVLAVTMLFTSTVAAECPDGWNLPGEVGTVEVSMPYEPGSLGTEFDVIVGGVGEGYSISNGVWAGWCADSIVDIYALTPYPVRILSSLDPNLAAVCPTCADDEQWDKINYLLNHRLPGASWMDVQAAIWYLSDAAPSFDLIPWTAGPLAQVMVDDANANVWAFARPPARSRP